MAVIAGARAVVCMMPVASLKVWVLSARKASDVMASLYQASAENTMSTPSFSANCTHSTASERVSGCMGAYSIANCISVVAVG